MPFTIFLIYCAGLVATGVILAVQLTSIVARAERVGLLVVDIAVEWVGEGERAKTVMYEVLDGQHRGFRSMSLVKGGMTRHSIGDRIDGMIDPKTRSVLSESDARYQFWQAVWIACVGVLIGVAAVVWPRS